MNKAIIPTFIAVILLLTAGAIGNRIGIEKGKEIGRREGMIETSMLILNELKKTEQLVIKGVNINGKDGDLILKPTAFNKYEN